MIIEQHPELIELIKAWPRPQTSPSSEWGFFFLLFAGRISELAGSFAELPVPIII